MGRYSQKAYTKKFTYYFIENVINFAFYPFTHKLGFEVKRFPLERARVCISTLETRTTLNVVLPLVHAFNYGNESYFFLAEIKCVSVYLCVHLRFCVCVMCVYLFYVLFNSPLE